MHPLVPILLSGELFLLFSDKYVIRTKIQGKQIGIVVIQMFNLIVKMKTIIATIVNIGILFLFYLINYIINYNLKSIYKNKNRKERFTIFSTIFSKMFKK